MSATTTVAALADLARAASRTLTVATGAERAAALNAIADEVESRSAEILAANKVDIGRGIAEGMHPQLQDRLLLTAERVKGIASGARQVAALEDPLGNVLRERTLPNGLHLKQISVPFGVIGMVYEARPNVTVDAAVILLMSGNAALLRGSSTAASSNAILLEVMRSALAKTNINPCAFTPLCRHTPPTPVVSAALWPLGVAAQCFYGWHCLPGRAIAPASLTWPPYSVHTFCT
jgi:glutamate-5-semialdehyde dehydrogenase